MSVYGRAYDISIFIFNINYCTVGLRFSNFSRLLVFRFEQVQFTMCLKTARCVANSLDPDQMPHEIGLHCLLKVDPMYTLAESVYFCLATTFLGVWGWGEQVWLS